MIRMFIDYLIKLSGRDDFTCGRGGISSPLQFPQTMDLWWWAEVTDAVGPDLFWNGALAPN